ncbi:MAG: transcriptional repressor [Candidatus Aminicenantes bacterium]|nr:transcriptional repressor [Candidatus Aminicenantes bacterium]
MKELKMGNWTIEEIKNFLIKNGIRPSFYRLKIYQYLLNERTHPSADEIFLYLKKEIPTISRATIYNTLNLFLNKRLVQLINLERDEARYDATLSWHAHFKCLNCNKVFDFHIESLKLKGVEGFQILEKQLNLAGYCAQCQKK